MIKIVTDSSSDLSKELIDQYGISVVPLYSRFGENVYKERVDITDDQFYQKMAESDTLPVTILPSPGDFVPVYEKLLKEADTIVSIHLSSKLSGTMNSAIQAKASLGDNPKIHIIDSTVVSIALGLIVLSAAKTAKEGGTLEQVIATANEAIKDTAPVCLLDSLKNLQKGGRIGKATALIGSLLNVKPLITMKNGEVVPFGKARSRSKGMDMIVEHVSKFKQIEDMAIAWSTTPDDAKALSERIAPYFKKGEVKIVRLGTTLGVHTGAGTIVVSVRGKL